MGGAAQLTLSYCSGLSTGSSRHHHTFKVFLIISGLRDNVSFFLNGSWNWVVTSQNQDLKSNICSALILVSRCPKLRGQFTPSLV